MAQKAGSQRHHRHRLSEESPKNRTFHYPVCLKKVQSYFARLLSLVAASNCCLASVAKASHRLLFSSDEWPLTQVQVSWCGCANVHNCSQRSWFLTGLPSAVFQPFFIHFWIHFLLKASIRYFESERKLTMQGAFKARSASRAAVISIRLLVVSSAEPECSLTMSPHWKTMPQPPKPFGFGFAPPSVQISNFFKLSSSLCKWFVPWQAQHVAEVLLDLR